MDGLSDIYSLAKIQAGMPLEGGSHDPLGVRAFPQGLWNQTSVQISTLLPLAL